MGKRSNRRRQKKSAEEIVVFTGDRNEDTEGAVRGLKPVPDLMKQGAYETQDQFISRLNRIVGKSMAEAEIEEKFDVDFCPKTGVPDHAEGKTKFSRKKQERRKEHKLKRKTKLNERKLNRRDDFGQVKDKVRFGEVTHAPPNMNQIRKKFDEQIKKIRDRKAKSMKF